MIRKNMNRGPQSSEKANEYDEESELYDLRNKLLLSLDENETVKAIREKEYRIYAVCDVSQTPK